MGLGLVHPHSRANYAGDSSDVRKCPAITRAGARPFMSSMIRSHASIAAGVVVSAIQRCSPVETDIPPRIVRLEGI